ncbi:MAG: hypothetical protein V1782_09110 [Pseudomonadota bacterium]
MKEPQQEIIYTLSELAEMRSPETGNHVRRVAEYSRLLAEKHGLSQMEAILDLIRRERGAHFDPVLVDLFFENIDTILEIRNRLAG